MTGCARSREGHGVCGITQIRPYAASQYRAGPGSKCCFASRSSAVSGFSVARAESFARLNAASAIRLAGIIIHHRDFTTEQIHAATIPGVFHESAQKIHGYGYSMRGGRLMNCGFSPSS